MLKQVIESSARCFSKCQLESSMLSDCLAYLILGLGQYVVLFIYLTLVAACGAFPLKHMWLDTVVSGFSLVRDLSWSFSCPPYCGSGVFVPLLAGFSLGSLFTIVILALTFIYFGFQLRLPSAPTAAPARSRSRLDGYLVHEQ